MTFCSYRSLASAGRSAPNPVPVRVPVPMRISWLVEPFPKRKTSCEPIHYRADWSTIPNRLGSPKTR